jgi:hypothetical protein
LTFISKPVYIFVSYQFEADELYNFLILRTKNENVLIFLAFFSLKQLYKYFCPWRNSTTPDKAISLLTYHSL